MERGADTLLWHPFADMSAVRYSEFVVSRAEGVWLWDDTGRRYLDGTASLWYANVGHGRPEIASVVAQQIRTLDAYHIFNDVANPPALELAQRLSDLAPFPNGRVMLSSGGGDAVDTAAKLARRYWDAAGLADRTHLISRTGGYHGTHGFGTSIAGIEANRVGYGSLVPNTSQVSDESVEALEQEIQRVGPEHVAAFFVEPVLGAGGVRLPPDGYLESVSTVCRKYDVLLVIDSVICAFGRLGTWYGIERWNITPDMIVFAKGVTSGYLPLGGVIVSGRIAEPFWEQPLPFRHGPTYAGHPVCCAAALANLDILERENLVRRGQELEADLLQVLRPLAAHPCVREVRAGLGLLAAVEIERGAVPPGVGPFDLYRRVREAGVVVRPLINEIAISPPLTIERDELELIGEAVEQGLDALLELNSAPRAGMAKLKVD